MQDRLQEFQAASRTSAPTTAPSPRAASPRSDARHAEVSALLAKDAAARACCAETSEALQDYRRVCLEVRRAALPSELRQRTLEMEEVERRAQGLLARARAAVAALQQDAPETGAPARAIRSSLAARQVEQLQELGADYFESRRAHRDDMQRRARRQLRIAYPNAAADDLEDVLLYPELTAIALARRVERGGATGGTTLQAVLDELSGTRGDLLRLEEKARELKVQLMEFAEQIDQRGEIFDRVEEEIRESADGVTKTVRVFSSAAREKERRDAQTRSRWYCIGFVVLGLLVFFFRKTVFWAGARTGYHVTSTGVGKAVAGATGAVTSVSNASLPALRGARALAEGELGANSSWNASNVSLGDPGGDQNESNFKELGNETTDALPVASSDAPPGGGSDASSQTEPPNFDEFGNDTLQSMGTLSNVSSDDVPAKTEVVARAQQDAASFLQSSAEVHQEKPRRRSREGAHLRLSLDAEGRAELDVAGPAEAGYLVFGGV